MNYTAADFHLHFIAKYTLIVKANFVYDILYVIDQEGQLLVYMKYDSNKPSEEALKLLSLPFQQVYVSLPQSNLTFIPADLYQEDDQELYQDFMENPNQAIEVADLDYLQIKAVFQYDVLLAQRWKSLFPEAHLIPEFKLNLMQVRPHVPLKGEVLGVVFNDTSTDLFLFINGQFQFFNNFEVITEDDLSYFILNLYQTFGIKDKVTKAIVSAVDLEPSFQHKLQQLADEVLIIKSNTKLKTDDELPSEVTSSYLIDLPLCV